MLVDFTVKNFCSIKGIQELSMVSTKDKGLRDTNIVAFPERKFSLVKSAAIYGPNGSGKTNLIEALYTMGFAVWNAQGLANKSNPVLPLIEPHIGSADKPTEFDIRFIAEDGNLYQYGFITTKERVLEEWLYALPKNRVQTWFHRKHNEHDECYDYKKCNYLKGPMNEWAKRAAGGDLFLPICCDEQLEPVVDWFDNDMPVLISREMSITAAINKAMDSCLNEKAVEFLQSFDLGISGVEYDRQVVYHDGFPVKFKDESSGILDMIRLTPFCIEALRFGQTLIIDDLGANLHPLLRLGMVKRFHCKESNPNDAQLIFTTNDTSLMNADVLRRDQIWIMEKNKGESSLVGLSEFKYESGRDMQRGYLDGRFGGVPYVQGSLCT